MSDEYSHFLTKKKKDKLEIYALEITSALCVGRTVFNDSEAHSDVCKNAIEIAKELIKQLDKE